VARHLRVVNRRRELVIIPIAILMLLAGNSDAVEPRLRIDVTEPGLQYRIRILGGDFFAFDLVDLEPTSSGGL